MIYTIKHGDPSPSTVGFTRRFTNWDRPTTGPSPVSFEMINNETSPAWRSRSLEQRAEPNWMFVTPLYSDFEQRGYQKIIKNNTWVQGDPKTLCPSRTAKTLINLPGIIEWNIYKQSDTIVIVRYGDPITPPKPPEIPGQPPLPPFPFEPDPTVELWTRNGIKVDTQKTWRQNGIKLSNTAKFSNTPDLYEIYPTFAPSSCWSGLTASKIYGRAFRRTTYVIQDAFNHVIEFCDTCYPKQCLGPNFTSDDVSRYLWFTQCCAKFCTEFAT